MNAIILAAGMGMRIRPLSENIPKSLIPINGVPIIEQQIRMLKSSGIDEIIIVIGYLAEKFTYLKSKYNVKLIINEQYSKYNNIYSLFLASEEFGNSYVLEGDVYIRKNCINVSLKQSAYYAVYKENYVHEWGLVTDQSGCLSEICIGQGTGLIMSGISYWNQPDANLIKSKIEEKIRLGFFEDLFWDCIVLDNLLHLKIDVFQTEGIYEIDLQKDILAVNALF